MAVEKGRYINLYGNNSARNTCNCNLKVIESECHFLLICPKHSDLRSKYIALLLYVANCTEIFQFDVSEFKSNCQKCILIYLLRKLKCFGGIHMTICSSVNSCLLLALHNLVAISVLVCFMQKIVALYCIVLYCIVLHCIVL